MRSARIEGRAPDVLYHMVNGDGTFTDVTAKAGVTRQESLAMDSRSVMEDLDGDAAGWILVLCTNDSGPNYFYRNERERHFRGDWRDRRHCWRTAKRQEQGQHGHCRRRLTTTAGLTFITTYANDNKTYFHNDGKGIYTDVSYASGHRQSPSIPSR